MASIGQIRGMMLEEAVLWLLQTSGFRVIDQPGNDPTLKMGPAGLEVRGRGERHQIDALAEFIVDMPFGHPQRLIVEAKCYTKSVVGIQVIRNAVGVLKDIGEYFVPPPPNRPTPNSRYHYRYAVFSATGFSASAQHYAFAQDVYLIPYTFSAPMRRVVDIINRLDPQSFGPAIDGNVDIDMTGTRREVRELFRNAQAALAPLRLNILRDDGRRLHLGEVIDMLGGYLSSLGGSLVCMANGQLLLHLVPDHQRALHAFLDAGLHGEPIAVEVRATTTDMGRGWALELPGQPNARLHFDVPPEILANYLDSGLLSRRQLLDIKEDMFPLEALHVDGPTVRRLRFALDPDWVRTLRRRLG